MPQEPQESAGGPLVAQEGGAIAGASLSVSAGADIGASASLDADLSAVYSSLLSAAQSLLVERQRFARKFGLSGFDQFGGARQINEVLGYPTQPLSIEDYRDRFENGGIARRIIMMSPEAMGWAKVTLEENRNLKKKTKLESAWESLCKRLAVGNVFKRADILAGIAEYSVIYIGVKEKKGTNTQDVDLLTSVMPTLRGPDDIAFLRPLPQDQAQIVSFVGDDPTDRVDDPRYGLPKFYNIQFSRSRQHVTGTLTGALNSTFRKVHWSRVIHVTHEPLDNEIYSTPELQPIWRYLCDLDKLAGGGSEIFWKQALQKVLFDLDKDIGPDGGSIKHSTPGAGVDSTKVAAFREFKEQMKIELEEMSNNLRQYVLSRGVTPKTIAADAPDFEANVKTIIGLISATKNKPQRKLLGSERGHLASTQDEKSDNDTIAARQDEYGSALVRDFVDRLIKCNGLPAPRDSYEIIWPVEDELSESDKAEVVKNLTLANLNQFQAGGGLIKSSAEIRDEIYGDEPLTLNVPPPPVNPQDTPTPTDTIPSDIATSEQHKFSSTQFDIPSPIREEIISLGLTIADEDLVPDGRETNPHITIKYGIETDNGALVATLVKGFGAVSLTIGKTDYFSSEDFDVVYLAVTSADLMRLNALISSSLKVTDTHPEYVPHITLAYVKAGEGEKYKGLALSTNNPLLLSALTFSSSDDTTTQISTL